MNSIKMLDLAHAVYDRFLQTDGEQRIDERRRSEVMEAQGPAPRESIQARVTKGALRLIGIDQAPSTGAEQTGVPAHTLNPNPTIRA